MKKTIYLLICSLFAGLMLGCNSPEGPTTLLKNDCLHRSWGIHMVGEELVLGPFQGPIACTRIAYGRGVCGTSWQRGETIVVPDVEQFPGHIACSSLSRSEIVVPVFAPDRVVKAVLDIDSEHLATFDVTDKEWLEKILDNLFTWN